MPCGPPKPRKAVFDTVLVFSRFERDADGGHPIGVVGMEHRAVHDAGGEIRRIAAAGEKLDRIALDAPLLVEADLPVAAEIVALAGEDEIVVAVEPQLARASR